MGSELLRIAEGFSIVAEGLRGLAKAEGGTKDKTACERAETGNKPEKTEGTEGILPRLEGIRALMAQKTQEGKSKDDQETFCRSYGAAKLFGGEKAGGLPGADCRKRRCWMGKHALLFRNLPPGGGSACTTVCKAGSSFQDEFRRQAFDARRHRRPRPRRHKAEKRAEKALQAPGF